MYSQLREINRHTNQSMSITWSKPGKWGGKRPSLKLRCVVCIYFFLLLFSKQTKSIFLMFDIQQCLVILYEMGQMFAWHRHRNKKFCSPSSDNRIWVKNWEHILYQSQSVHYFLLHSCGKTFMAVMVNIQLSEFLRNSTLMASRNLAACQNKSPAWPSPGLVCPGGRLFMRITVTMTVQLSDEQGMKEVPYLAGITLWPSGPWDLLSTSNHRDQGPAMGHTNISCSLDVGVRCGEFSPGRLTFS